MKHTGKPLPKKPSFNGIHTSVHLTQDQRDWLERQAKTRNITVSAVVRNLINKERKCKSAI